MPILRYYYPFHCPKCGKFESETTTNHKCLHCGANIQKIAEGAQSGPSDLFLALLFLFVVILVLLFR